MEVTFNDKKSVG